MKVYSNSFKNGERIPKKHTCDGVNVSPQLAWDKVSGASSYAIIVEDPDAPSGTFIHWVIYNILGTSIPEGVRPNSEVGIQGKNDFGRMGYGGPCPPHGNGNHRYFFKVYALNSQLPAVSGVSANRLNELIQNKIVDSGEIMGIYSRD